MPLSVSLKLMPGLLQEDGHPSKEFMRDQAAAAHRCASPTSLRSKRAAHVPPHPSHAYSILNYLICLTRSPGGNACCY